jgi:hypothetical protein
MAARDVSLAAFCENLRVKETGEMRIGEKCALWLVWVLCLVPAACWSESAVRIKPHLNNVTQTGVTFGWETVEPSTGEVTVTAEGTGDPIVGEDTESKTVHLLRVEGPTP